MIGVNELHLCREETMKAMEMYLNDVQFKEPVRVTSLEQVGETFVIQLAARVEEGSPYAQG